MEISDLLEQDNMPKKEKEKEFREVKEGDKKYYTSNGETYDYDPKKIFPEFDSEKTEELWGKYQELNKVTEDGKINRPRDRSRRIRGATRKLSRNLEGILGLNEEEVNLEKFDEKEAKRRASQVIAKLAHEGYKSLDKKHKEPNEDLIRLYLKDVFGDSMTYEDLIKEMVNAEDLGYDTLDRSAPGLKRLIDHIALSKDTEGRKLQSVRRALARIEHHKELRHLIGHEVGRKYNRTVTPQELFNEHDSYIQSKSAMFGGREKTTYGKRVAPEPEHKKDPKYKKHEYQPSAP